MKWQNDKHAYKGQSTIIGCNQFAIIPFNQKLIKEFNRFLIILCNQRLYFMIGLSQGGR